MTATIPSTALATIQPTFTPAERLALAGFLAGYCGLTREAYAFDLRQFSGWCRARSLPLFSVRRSDIETFARELEARGRARRWTCSAQKLQPARPVRPRSRAVPASARSGRGDLQQGDQLAGARQLVLDQAVVGELEEFFDPDAFSPGRLAVA